ncbi:MAG: hypothetical protein ACTHKM_09660 [Tsuneonella sp.]
MQEEQLGFSLDGGGADNAPLFPADQIRRDALDLIAKAQVAAGDGSWSADDLRYQRIIFPLLVSWLPDEDERAQLCFDFETEADKIELLLAA